MHNPYKYTGPLNPVNDELVCLPRTTQLNKVIRGIMKPDCDYMVVLGPRQIGKTTLLHQIAHEYATAAYPVYFNFETSPASDENLYQWLTGEIQKYVPCKPMDDVMEKWAGYIPEIRFFNFLEHLETEEEDKKILLFFDEIERMPSVKNFLHLWRRVYHERFNRKKLSRYCVIIAGSTDLLGMTVGPTSPFNIAKKIHLEDLSPKDAETLIDRPFEQLNVTVEKEAKDFLLAQTNGHPQMLQHICHLLADTAIDEERGLTLRDVQSSVNLLYWSNYALETLERDLEKDDKLKRLLKDLLNGTPKKFFAYKKYAISGAGPIVQHNQVCMLRNLVFETFLRDFFHEKESHRSERYKKIREVGRGTMGAVYKAEDTVLEREIALKVVNRDLSPLEIERFYSEARATASLTHSNIVILYDVGQENEEHFISMEFIEGTDVMKILDRVHRFTVPQVLYITIYMVKALEFSHDKGVVHRDIKPKNIMVNREGEVKIVDFGIAVIKGRQVSGDTGYVIGSPFYMAPEQFMGGDVDNRVDIYSAGVSIFHLLTGEVPFKGEGNMKVWNQHLTRPVPPISRYRDDVPRSVEKLVEKCMAKDKEDRFASAAQLLEELRYIADGRFDEHHVREELKTLVLQVLNDPEQTTARDEPRSTPDTPENADTEETYY